MKLQAVFMTLLVACGGPSHHHSYSSSPAAPPPPPPSTAEGKCTDYDATEEVRGAACLQAADELAPKDLNRANDLYDKACANKSVKACVYLAGAYANGAGFPKSEKNAFSYYRIACDLGDERSCTAIGPAGAPDERAYRKFSMQVIELTSLEDATKIKGAYSHDEDGLKFYKSTKTLDGFETEVGFDAKGNSEIVALASKTERHEAFERAVAEWNGIAGIQKSIRVYTEKDNELKSMMKGRPYGRAYMFLDGDRYALGMFEGTGGDGYWEIRVVHKKR
jgi:TPR repeat protein